jgi:5-(carboxyamino)imidazole ribonucleotide synthase
MPLGDPTQHSPAVMINLLGDLWPTELEAPDWTPVLNHPRAKLHLYGKRRAFPRRKMGHFTVLGETTETAFADAMAINEALIGQKKHRAESGVI